jgi:hypothetical protein
MKRCRKMRRRSSNKRARCQKNLEKRITISGLEGMKNGKNSEWVGVPHPTIFDSIQEFRRWAPLAPHPKNGLSGMSKMKREDKFLLKQTGGQIARARSWSKMASILLSIMSYVSLGIY